MLHLALGLEGYWVDTCICVNFLFVSFCFTLIYTFMETGNLTKKKPPKICTYFAVKLLLFVGILSHFILFFNRIQQSRFLADELSPAVKYILVLFCFVSSTISTLKTESEP